MEESAKYRKLARQRLKGFWKDSFIVSFFFVYTLTLLYLLEYYAQTNDILYVLTMLFVFIVTFPLNYGYFATVYKIRNLKKYSYFDVFILTFKNFKRALSILLNILIKILPFFILFLVTVMILAFGTTVIINSNSTVENLSSFNLMDNTTKIGVVSFFIGLIGYIICIILFIPKFLLYSLSFLIGINEPELKPKQIVEKSAYLMKRHRIKLFSLLISFIFWAIIALIPFTICLDILRLPLVGLTVFLLCFSLLLPYVIFSVIEFYEDRKKENSQN